MEHRLTKPVVVRGAGDLATGVIQKLHNAGFAVYALEIEYPSAIRRCVSLSEAVYDKKMTVEDVTAYYTGSVQEARDVISAGCVPVLIDPEMKSLAAIQPLAVIDAVLAKRNTGLKKSMAPVTIGMGPGFSAGIDCDLVIETMRGHDLGKLIAKGAAAPNTGNPGEIGGYSIERVIRAPRAGKVRLVKQIGDLAEAGETVLFIDDTPVPAPMSGVIRGLIRDGYLVSERFKIGDVDPRLGERKNCYTISDKARALGGAALEGVILLLRQKGLWPC